jgi:large subunit ribosomal protein L23
VPLKFNKFDLRDYLFHAYSVPTLGIRSRVHYQKPVKHPRTLRWYRPQFKKTMTAELVQPFVWPARPEDKTPWLGEMEEKRNKQLKDRDSMAKKMQKTGAVPLRINMAADGEKMGLRKEAKRLLSGEAKWENKMALDPKFAKK